MIPREWLESARIVHLAPVANELRPLPDLRRPGRIVGLTAQGLLRQLGPDTPVRAADPHLTHRELLMMDAIVVSREDVAALPSLPRTWSDFVPLVVVTLAEAGAMYLETGRRFRDVPTRPVPSTGPTGAGDLFAAALFAALLAGQKPRAAVDSANRFVGAVLELRPSTAEDQALHQAAAGLPFVARPPAAGYNPARRGTANG